MVFGKEENLADSIAGGFVTLNLIVAIANLIPFNTTFSGIKAPSDGLLIFRVLTKPVEELKPDFQASKFFESYELYESKAYDKAIAILNDLCNGEINQPHIGINLGIMYCKTGDYQRSLEAYKKVEALLTLKESTSYKALLYNNMAWTYLVVNDAVNAERYSKLAIDIDNREKHFRGTRGTALLASGDVDRAYNYFNDLANFKFANSNTLLTAVHLAYIYHIQNKPVLKNKCLEFVEKNLDTFDSDELVICNRVLEKLNFEALRPLNSVAPQPV
jgi:tetratricopeptide (TPR) repeat protein